ncbi:MAG: phenylalanine--tRNA ligase beta subunit-related protein, partial [Candidatus Saccharimonadales bacterium]
DIVIANRERAIGLGGVMGGQDSEIGARTSEIVLECANFDMFRIRRSSMAHGVFSEAVTRFNKGLSPLVCPSALSFAVDLIKELCPSAELTSEVVDAHNQDSVKALNSVSLDLNKLNGYLGIELAPKEALALLANVEIEADTVEKTLSTKPPFWRTDLVHDVDLIEEIARLYGFDRLPQDLPGRIIEAPSPDLVSQSKRQIRGALAAAGANEVLTYSFVNQALLESAGQDPSQAYKLTNALSPELEYYRISLTPSLLSKVHLNHKAGFERFAIFEIGKAHLIGQVDQEGLPNEEQRLSIVISADIKSAKQNYEGDAFYQAREWLDYLLGAQNCDASELLEFIPLEKAKLSDEPFWSAAASTFQKGRSAMLRVNSKTLGVIGEFSAKSTKALKLPPFCSGIELDLSLLSELSKTSAREYQELSRFPNITQDLTIISDRSKIYIELASEIDQKLAPLMPKDVEYKLLPIDAYLPESKPDSVSWTFRLKSQSTTRTLTDKEIAAVISKLLESV